MCTLDLIRLAVSQKHLIQHRRESVHREKETAITFSVYQHVPSPCAILREHVLFDLCSRATLVVCHCITI